MSAPLSSAMRRQTHCQGASGSSTHNATNAQPIRRPFRDLRFDSSDREGAAITVAARVRYALFECGERRAALEQHVAVGRGPAPDPARGFRLVERPDVVVRKRQLHPRKCAIFSPKSAFTLTPAAYRVPIPPFPPRAAALSPCSASPAIRP